MQISMHVCYLFFQRKEKTVTYIGQLISKANCQTVNSSKKRTNEFVFTSMRCVFVRFLEEIEDSEKTFRNLTFSSPNNFTFMQ